jgi:galactokinase
MMNDCQYNFKNYYNNSCPELEELTQLARDSGAIGSKQSGAGWGGCCVSMVPKDKVNEFLTKIRSYYVKERPEDEKLLIPNTIDDNIFVT